VGYVATASPTTLRQRAAILAAIRAFFAARGVLEVETPALSPAGVPDPALESITATVHSLGQPPHYLHTSPEFAMKRLLASGSGDIFQICRVFRDDELGRWHQPEFTLLEWYRVGWDDQQLMTEVEALFQTALAAASGRAAAATHPSVRVRYADALQRAIGAPAGAPTPVLVDKLRAAGIDVPANLLHDAVLDLAFSTAVVASFDAAAFTFVHDYPASQAALARLKPGDASSPGSRPSPPASRYSAAASSSPTVFMSSRMPASSGAGSWQSSRPDAAPGGAFHRSMRTYWRRSPPGYRTAPAWLSASTGS